MRVEKPKEYQEVFKYIDFQNWQNCLVCADLSFQGIYQLTYGTVPVIIVLKKIENVVLWLR